MNKQVIHFSRKIKPGIYLAVLIGLFFGCASHPSAADRDAGPKRITDLSITRNSGALTVSIKTSGSVTYTVERLDFPMGILLYFPDARLNLERRIYTLSDHETISSIKANEVLGGKTAGARIFVAFKKDTPYRLTPDGSGLKLTFPETKSPSVEPEARAKSIEKISPAAGTAARAPTAGNALRTPPAARHLKKVTATPLKNNIAVNVIADGTITNYKSFSMDNPARIVFDLYNLESPYKGQQITEVRSKWVKRIRHFGHPDRVRLVLETENNYQEKYSALPKDTGLLIHVGDVPAGAAKARPATSDERPATGKVTVAWDSVPGADSYNVYWRASPGVNRQNGNKIADIKSPTTTLKGLKVGTTYYFVVTSIKGLEESRESEELSFTVNK